MCVYVCLCVCVSIRVCTLSAYSCVHVCVYVLSYLRRQSAFAGLQELKNCSKVIRAT